MSSVEAPSVAAPPSDVIDTPPKTAPSLARAWNSPVPDRLVGAGDQLFQRLYASIDVYLKEVEVPIRLSARKVVPEGEEHHPHSGVDHVHTAAASFAEMPVEYRQLGQGVLESDQGELGPV
jgi:hypothetical protein